MLEAEDGMGLKKRHGGIPLHFPGRGKLNSLTRLSLFVYAPSGSSVSYLESDADQGGNYAASLPC